MRIDATRVAMPETPPDVNNLLTSLKDNVRLAGKSWFVQSEPVTHRVYGAAYGELWFCMLTPNLAHVSAAPDFS
jgi:hypothetical protein